MAKHFSNVVVARALPRVFSKNSAVSTYSSRRVVFNSFGSFIHWARMATTAVQIAITTSDMISNCRSSAADCMRPPHRNWMGA